MAHTPGPWSASFRNTQIAGFAAGWDVGSESLNIALVPSIGPESSEEVAANARLVAAAPDLAAALDTLLAASEGMIGADCPFCGAEGSWTDEHDPAARRMVPLRHRESCAYEAGYAALAKAGLIVGVEIG